jgi:ribosomal RNA-processing protein 17
VGVGSGDEAEGEEGEDVGQSGGDDEEENAGGTGEGEEAGGFFGFEDSNSNSDSDSSPTQDQGRPGRSSNSAKKAKKDVVRIPMDREDEYIDEDKYTTVLVEEVDVDREGMKKVCTSTNFQADSTVDGSTVNGHPGSHVSTESKMSGKKGRRKDGSEKKKVKRKKFRYESKGERRLTREKERSKNHRQAMARKGRE